MRLATGRPFDHSDEGRPYSVAVPTLERPLERFSVDALRDTVTTFRDTMHAHQDGINRLNVYPVPDGDTGTNMARTLDAVVAEMEAAAGRPGPDVRRHQPRLADGRRGNSGVILSQIMRGIASTLKGAVEATAATVAEALEAASVAAYQAVLKPIEGTILDRRPGERRRRRARRPPPASSLADVLRAAATPAGLSLARTPDLLPVLRRRRRRRRRRRLPPAARRRPPRRRRRAAARARPTTRTPAGGDAFRPSPTGVGRRRRARRQRAALRGDVPLRPRRRRTSRRSSSAGARSATRSSSSAATARGTATSTRTTSARPSRPSSTSTVGRTADPGHRPVRGGRRRARPPGGRRCQRRRRRAAPTCRP